MNDLGWLLLALASVVVGAWVAVFVAVRALYRRIRRNLNISGSTLRVRAQLSHGSRREVLKLRMRLKEALDSGQAAIDLAVRSEGPRGELPQLFRRVTGEGGRLEAQLRLLESENDEEILAEMLPAARSRVDEVTHLVRRLRSVVGSGLGDLSDDSLTALRSDVDREVTAVRAGMQELHDLNGRDAFSDHDRRPSTDPFTKD